MSTMLIALILLGAISLPLLADSSADPSQHPSTAQRAEAFPIFLAKYANGDWNFGTHFDSNGEVDGGKLYHLVASMKELSRDHICAAVKCVDLDSTEFQRSSCSLLVFTGSKDFSLTPQEIQNLRWYLQCGGKIWGDAAVGGSGGAFDVAFRREMKRVLPEPDKKFQPVPHTEMLFTRSWFNISDPQLGAISVEHVAIGGDLNDEMAIIYTPDHVLDKSVLNEHLGMDIIWRLLLRIDSGYGLSR